VLKLLIELVKEQQVVEQLLIIEPKRLIAIVISQLEEPI
jgi:hypothetical protein